jgi:DNA-binding protein H-NS
VFQETTRTDQALKQQLLGAFDEMYTKSLSNCHTGFATITTFDIIQYLYQTYGMISQVNLKDNTACMNEPYDPTTPIENLFDQIEVAAEYADAANHPFSMQQTVTAGYLLIFATGLYTEECKLWNRRPAAEQTWVNFKITFSRAHKELREMQAMTAQMGATTMGMANHTEEIESANAETAQALADLASATVADRTAVANLTQANATLTSQLADMKAMLTLMSEQMRSMQNAPPPTRPRVYDRNSEHYCWSHGRTRNPNHVSSNCRNKKEGHQDDATLHNRKGGSNNRCGSAPDNN